MNNVYKAILIVTKFTFRITLILLLSLEFGLANTGKAQVVSIKDKKVNLNIKEEKLLHVFEEIESKTDYEFSYSKDKINLDERVTLSANAASVERVLLNISKQHGLRFRQKK